jgi:putative transposase
MHPWHVLLAFLAGAVHEEQQQVIEYLRTENQVLKEKLGKKCNILN